MGSVSNQRINKPGWITNDVPNSSGASLSANSKKKWSNLMTMFVILVVLAEIAFLGRLDMAKNAALLADSLYLFTSPAWSSPAVASGDEVVLGIESFNRSSEGDSCEEWLERVDSVEYFRDFEEEPIVVTGGDQDWKSCAVGCKFGFDASKMPDAAFGLPQQSEVASVLRSMESSQYYYENNVDVARGRGYSIVMTTSLSSDVPVGYFSWAEYNIMAPLQPKTEKALAAAFISNCGARNFRLQALEALEKANIKIDSYGGCHRNRDGRGFTWVSPVKLNHEFYEILSSVFREDLPSEVDKVETLKRYKFSLAFENSNEEDYVTEKFFQSLVAGSVPVVIGAPNIQDFAPSPGSLLHIKELQDVESVAKTMKYLAENADAYNQSLRWKFEGPSDSFKALVDMAAVHSSCRLCIHLATKIREKEEKSPRFLKRPCKCVKGLETIYHVYVRERGRFEMESVFLSSSNLRLEALGSAVLLKFESLKHIPIWKPERPESIRGEDELKIYRIYPVGKTQREALYTYRFDGDADFRSHIERNPCAKFEVIFV